MGPEKDYLEFFASLGVGGILGGMMFYFYRRDSQKYIEELKKQSDLNTLREDRLIEVLTKTATGYEKICSSINELSSALRKSEETRLQQLLPILEKIIAKNG